MLSTLKGINEVRSYVTRTAFTRHVEHEISHWPLQAWLNFGKRWQCLQKARPTLSDVDDETNYRMGRLIVVSLALRCTRACAMHPTSGEVSGDVGICRHCTRAMNGVLRERSFETAFFYLPRLRGPSAFTVAYSSAGLFAPNKIIVCSRARTPTTSIRPHTTAPLQRRKVKSFPRKCQISKCSEKKKRLKLVPLQPRNCALRWEKAWLQDPLHTLLPLATPPQVAITSRGDCAHLLSPAKATLHSMLSKIVPST